MMDHRRAEFFRIENPLNIEIIRKRCKGVKNKSRKVNDKNNITEKITLNCSLDGKNKKDGNYSLNIDIEYQIRSKKGMPYQKTRDFFEFIFFPKNKLLVVLGRDDAIHEAINQVSEILYPDAERLRMFNPVKFSVDSLKDTIMQMRGDDLRSWCSEFNARYDGKKYQKRKTKFNFSLGEQNCVFDDDEALEAIDEATSISPKYKFYTCPRLTTSSYDSPKTMSFNGRYGVITISSSQSSDNWYKFISEFLINSLCLILDHNGSV